MLSGLDDFAKRYAVLRAVLGTKNEGRRVTRPVFLQLHINTVSKHKSTTIVPNRRANNTKFNKQTKFLNRAVQTKHST